MKIDRAKLSCYSRWGSGYGVWETDVYLEGDKDRNIVRVSEEALMTASGSKRKGTVKTPQEFLNTEKGKEWLLHYLLSKSLVEEKK